MDKLKAIELLKRKSNEAAYIASLPHSNTEYVPWRRNIEDVLEEAFGVNSTEYRRVASMEIRDIEGPRSELQRFYIGRVAAVQSEVNSIIQKYEDLGIGAEPSISEGSPSVFVSHGKESVALRKLAEFIETLGIDPLIVKKQPSLDKDLPGKVNFYLNQADFVIILATGDDTMTNRKTGTKIIQPRQNVVHEIGLAQKTHPGRIIYLLEEGASFPSNIRPKVWESFKQRNMMDAFHGIVRELRAYGILKVMKHPAKGHLQGKWEGGR